MATKKYETHSSPTKISATSRASIKVATRGGDNFYTVEATEEKAINSTDGIDMDEEFKMLFDELNGIIDNQCEDIIKAVKK